MQEQAHAAGTRSHRDGSPTGRPRVVVIGDALVDEVVVDGTTTRHPGGSALNVAIGLARLDVPALLLATIGDDDAGELIRAELARYGVLLAATRNAIGTGLARSERIAGEPRYAFSEAAVARDLAFDETQLDAVLAARVLAVSGFPFDAEATAERLRDAIGRSDALVAIDPNPRAGLIRDLTAYRETFDRVASGADLLKLGTEDLELLYGRSDDALRAEVSRRCGMLLATEGSQGGSLWIGGEHVAASPTLADPSRVVDTMGAGDATFATFVAGLARDGRDVDGDATLRLAMRIAAATVAEPGALLRLPDVD